MGYLGIARFVPQVLTGLFAGVLVDRVRRRPLLVWADLGRAALTAAVPLAACAGVLRMELLYLVAALTGALTVLFDVAYQSFVPSVVPRAELTAANSKLQLAQSVATTSGPSLGGALVQLLAAPLVVVVDAASFVVSALSLAGLP